MRSFRGRGGPSHERDPDGWTVSRWAGGFGVGGFFIGSLVVIVLGYFVVAAFG